MSRLELDFLEKLGDHWQGATPGFCVQAYRTGKKVVDVEVGETFPYYDWASLTKIVFTTTAFMFLHDKKAYRLNDPIHRWVSWFPNESAFRVRDLLSHSAGMTWWYPFYQTVTNETEARVLDKSLKDVAPEDAWQVFSEILRRQVLEDISKNGVGAVHSAIKSVYSDLDFFLLGEILQTITGRSLYENWTEVHDRSGFMDTDFHRRNKPKHLRKLYAPTEDCPWRKKVLQGEVDDENAWSLQGVAPHAGLFGPIEDLSRWGLLLRSAIRGEDSKRFAASRTVQLFTKRAIPRERGDWALGFMMPTKGSASCGPEFSLQSVGHTGFTGTSLWYDPKKDLLITILSNRVHPTREKKEFQKLRPLIHTWIVDSI